MIVFVSVFTDKSLKEEEEFAAEEAIEKRIVVSRRLEEHALRVYVFIYHEEVLEFHRSRRIRDKRDFAVFVLGAISWFVSVFI